MDIEYMRKYRIDNNQKLHNKIYCFYSVGNVRMFCTKRVYSTIKVITTKEVTQFFYYFAA